jgi:hypothetical protein
MGPMIPKFLLYLGVSLVGMSSAIYMHLYFRLRSVGINRHIWPDVLSEYLRSRKNHDWPAWPAYLYWPLFLIGFVILAVGVFHIG